MSGNSGRVAAIIIFVGLIVSVIVFNGRSTTGEAAPGLASSHSSSSSGSSSQDDPKAGSSRYGFRLTEVSKSVGIDFVHQAPTFDAKLAHIMPQIASMGAGV
ncbi:hypothetical protein ACYOEI_40650, partial [Singulisphaera rosea]